MTRENYTLKQSLQPYTTIIIIFSIVTLFAFYTALNSHDWAIVFATSIFWVAFAPYVYIGLSYKIYLQDNEMIQRASGGNDVIIKIKDIDRIVQETSNVQTSISMKRPFRRIAIYDEQDHFIDISLKHFSIADIRNLMRKIQNIRPDLKVPLI